MSLDEITQIVHDILGEKIWWKPELFAEMKARGITEPQDAIAQLGRAGRIDGGRDWRDGELLHFYNRPGVRQ